MIVLIHGLHGTGEEMAPFARALGARYPVFAPTLLGHGGRPMADAISFEAMLDDLAEMIEVNTSGPSFLVGFSLGGLLALALARRFPERVLGVAAIATKLEIDERAVAHMRHLLAPDRPSRTAERKAYLESVFGAGNLERVLAAALVMYEGFGRVPPLSEADLRALDLPVLLLSGERDPLAPGDEMRAAARLLPRARLGLFPGPAHPIPVLPMLEVARAIQAFIEDVSGGHFEPGEALDLTPSLVAGGTANADVKVTIGRARD